MAEYSGADATVQATNDSSIVSKASTAAAGYFEDPFVGHVAIRGPKGRLIRRSPLVHRCYYVRHLGVFQMQETFLRSCISPGDAYNVVVLGAGFDTGALRRGWPHGLRGYFEVDFPAVLQRKEALLKQAQVLRPDWLHSCGADLRDTSEVEASLRCAGVDFMVPTLLIAEVVLAYMENSEGDELIAWVAKAFRNCLFGVYEQIGPHDSFGRFMRKHFSQRQCPLRALLANPDLECQKIRFRAFDRVDAADMMSILAAAPVDELKRAFQLEAFDEFEEFHLKCVHYFCLAAISGTCTRARRQWQVAVQTNSCAVNPMLMPVEAVSLAIPRFGLAASFCSGHIVISGGQGTFNATTSDAPHGRQVSIMAMKLEAYPFRSCASKQIGEHAAAMYCTCTTVNDQVFVFGGRLAPQRPSAALGICTCPSSGPPSIRQVHEAYPWPMARWRHTATKIHLGGPGLLVLGGIGEALEVLSLEEAWFLDTDSLTWQQFFVEPAPDGGFPVARHSHAAALGSGGVLVCGGLDADEHILGDAWTLHAVFDGIQNRFRLAWRRALSPLPRPRYGHNLHEYFGHFIVVGGIDATLGSASICAFGKSFAVSCSAMRDGEPEIFMWHNLASVMLEDSEFLVILGGGGNCFSFGTHLNQSARLLNLRELIKQAEKSQTETLCAQCLGWCWGAR
ncbi:unnamed protein product [Durusdinium trenchii]|uniref:tRNA wybutosine-synthesizing protein 4 n=2 Tax=Durusdinium trenchii TaxID=1381693 RepID=A0ABP0N110_9DINO